MRKVRVNEGYELYQIITDFGDPLEIFREGIQNQCHLVKLIGSL